MSILLWSVLCYRGKICFLLHGTGCIYEICILNNIEFHFNPSLRNLQRLVYIPINIVYIYILQVPASESRTSGSIQIY